MNTIQKLFEQAQLAEAAYADFINPNTGAIYIKDSDIQTALIAAGFSKDPNSPTLSAQATAFTTQPGRVRNLLRTAHPTALLCWLMTFALMWLVIGNLGVLPSGLLWYAVPLSFLEVLVGAWVCRKLAPPCVAS